MNMKEFNVRYKVCGAEPDSQLDFTKYVQISFKIRNNLITTIFKNILSSNPTYSKLELKEHIYNTFGGCAMNDQ